MLPGVGGLGLGDTNELRGLQDMETQADPRAGALGVMKTILDKQTWKAQGHLCDHWHCRSNSDRGGPNRLMRSKL